MFIINNHCIFRTRLLYSHLEEVISVTRATRLSLTVLSTAIQLSKTIVKVFRSDFIEKLHVSANWWDLIYFDFYLFYIVIDH